MGEVVAAALKLGVKALPAIFAEYGFFGAFFAFFAFMPLGHSTIGILLVVIGLFYPAVPVDRAQHKIKIGSEKMSLAVEGNTRTMLFGIGAGHRRIICRGNPALKSVCVRGDDRGNRFAVADQCALIHAMIGGTTWLSIP